MKTKFTTFGGGLITGLLLMLLVSATTKENADPPPNSDELLGPWGLRRVPIEAFFQNVARYRSMHVKAVKPLMPVRPGAAASGNPNERTDPARMFTYEVSFLESFFTLIKALAIEGGLNPEETAIRFYYGVYPKDETNSGHYYGNLHTLFMVPNYWSDEDQRYRDIDLYQLANTMKKFENEDLTDSARQRIIRRHYLENLHRTNAKAGVFLLDASAVKYSGPLPSRSGSLVSPEPPVMNQGQLCPPNCPGITLLDYIDSLYPGPVPQ